MNKILYEASYIGSPKIFFDQVFTILLFIFGIGLSVHKLRKMKDTEEINLRYKINSILAYMVIVVFGIVGSMSTIGEIWAYKEIILGYKKGEYREVEGIVEDYRESKVDRFTVNGVEFEIPLYSLTWGYTYWHDENVITGDGQHLRIRYMPPNFIVYIEEIVDE